MIKLPLCIVLALAIAAPAVAQVKADPAPDRFDAADTNRDGQVSREERRQMWRQMRGQRRPG